MDDLKNQLLKEREQFEFEKIAWNRFQVQKSKELHKKLEDLMKIQNDLQDNNLPSYILNNKDEEECSKLKQEINNLKDEYNTKLSQYEQLKKNLNKEKEDFELYSNNIRNEIKAKNTILEKENNELIKKEYELEQRSMDINKKQNDLENKNEDFNKIRDFVIEQNIKNLKDEKDLENAEYKKNIFYNKLLEEENIIEDEKKRINEEINNIEDVKNMIMNERKEIEQLKQEINLRKKCIDDLCNKNINKDFNIQNYYLLKIYDENLNGGNIYDINFNRNDKWEKYKTDNFSSELYLLKIRNRIDINKIKMEEKNGAISKKFDLAKEQEYLIKSNESLKKIKK